MVKIILADKGKLDNRTSLEEINEVDSIDSLSNDEAVVHVMENTANNFLTLNQQTHHTLYIPATSLSLEDDQEKNVYVYFDLENYPFYKSTKEIIEQNANNEKPKGVFRYRRMVTEADKDQTLSTDLYVIFSLLGQPVNVHVTRTNQQKKPAHTILLLNFGEGTLAHVEYTVADQNKIELEWSGIKRIIEFDSNEMNPFNPTNKSKLPLMYSVDSILKTAQVFDETLAKQLRSIKKLINGGGQK